jgi:hypothetical protein
MPVCLLPTPKEDGQSRIRNNNYLQIGIDFVNPTELFFGLSNAEQSHLPAKTERT